MGRSLQRINEHKYFCTESELISGIKLAYKLPEDLGIRENLLHLYAHRCGKKTGTDANGKQLIWGVDKNPLFWNLLKKEPAIAAVILEKAFSRIAFLREKWDEWEEPFVRQLSNGKRYAVICVSCKGRKGISRYLAATKQFYCRKCLA